MRSVLRHGTLSAVVLVVLGAVAGCTPGGSQSPTPTTPTPSGQTDESSPESVTPSITREVPRERRQPLAQIPTDELCRLVTPEELGQLAFPVDEGRPREAAFDPPARACTFDARTGVRSVLIGVQPTGYGQMGTDEVALGSVRGTKILHANDCTVFADVSGATLQVAVTAGEADSDQCETAQAVAQYVLAVVVH